MNYTGLFKRVLLLLTNPEKAWEEIKQEESVNIMYANFMYPMIAITSLVTFFAGLIYASETSPYPIFQKALTDACAYAIALFGGSYLAVYLVDAALKIPYFKGLVIAKADLVKLVGYSFVVVFIYFMLASLFLQLAMILLVLEFYIIYIVWLGLKSFVPQEHERKVSVTFLIGVMVIVIPLILKNVFFSLV